MVLRWEYLKPTRIIIDQEGTIWTVSNSTEKPTNKQNMASTTGLGKKSQAHWSEMIILKNMYFEGMSPEPIETI